MPLIRYEIRNEHSLANPQLYKTASKDDPEGLLEGVAMAGLVGIVRQLGDLAEFAADIFRDLHEEVMTTASRGHELLVRVQQLEAEMPAVEKALLSETNQLRFAYTPGAEWHASIRNDQNHCTNGDLPRFIRGSYEECRGPPRLFKLDKFDVAGAGACLKRYTDPSFFRTEWASSELMKAEKAQRDKRARREKKGRRRRNVDETESISVDHPHSRFNPEYSKEFVPPGTDHLHPRMWQLPVTDREQASAVETLNYNPSIGFKPPAESSQDHTRAGASSSSLHRLESDSSLDGTHRLEYQSSMEGLQRLDSKASDVSRIESQASGLSRMDSQTSMEPERPNVRDEPAPPRHEGLYRIRDEEAGDTYSGEHGGMSRRWEEVDYSEHVVEEKPQLSPKSPPSPRLSQHSPPSPQLSPHSPLSPQLSSHFPKEDVKDADDGCSDGDQFVDALATMDSEVESDSEPRSRNHVDANSDRMSDAKEGSVSPQRDEVSAPPLHSRASSFDTLSSREQQAQSSKKSNSRSSSGRLSSEKLDMAKIVSPPLRLHSRRKSKSSSSSSSSASSSPRGGKQGKVQAQFAESCELGSVSSFDSGSGRNVSKMIAEIEKRTLEQIQDDERREKERDEEDERQLELQREQERLEALELEKKGQEELRQEQLRKEQQLEEEQCQERIRQEELRKEELEQARLEEIRQEEVDRERIRQEKMRMEQILQQEFLHQQALREKLRREQARLEQVRLEEIRQEEERRKEEQRQCEERQRERKQEEERQRHIKVSVYPAKKLLVEDPRAPGARQSQEEISPRTLPPLSLQSSAPPTIEVEVPSPSSSPMSLSSGSSPDSPIFSAFHSLSPIRTSRNVLSSPESRPGFVTRPGYATEMMSPTSPVPILALSMSPTSRSGSPPPPPLEWPGMQVLDSPTSPSNSFNKYDVSSPSSSPKAPEARSSFDSQTEHEAKSSTVSPKVAEVKSSSVAQREPELRFSSTTPLDVEIKRSSISPWEPEVEPPITSVEPARRSSSSSREEPQERYLSSSPRRHHERSPSTSPKESAAKSPFTVAEEPEEKSPSNSPMSPEPLIMVTRGQDPYPSVKPSLVSLEEPEVTLDSSHLQKPEVKLTVAVPLEPDGSFVSPRSEDPEVAVSPVMVRGNERQTPGRPSTSSSSSSEGAAKAISKQTNSKGPQDSPDEDALLESSPSEDSDFSPPVSPTSSVEDFSTTVAGKLLADFSSAIPSSENLQELASVSRAIFKKDLLLPQSESESEPELSPLHPQKYTSDNLFMPGPSRLSEAFPSSSSVSYDGAAPQNDVQSKASSPPRSSAEDENLSTALVPASPASPAPEPTTFDLDPILRSHYELRLSPPFRKSDSSAALKPRDLPPLAPVRTTSEHFSSRPLLLPPSVSDSRTAASAVSSIPPPPAPPARPSVSFRGFPSKPVGSLPTLSPPGARPLPSLPAPTPPTKNQGGNGEFNASQRSLHELPQPPPAPSRPLHELPPPPLPTAKRGVAGENVQDALLEAIALHDKTQLKKVKTMQNPVPRRPDDRSHLLEQIRSQSFNLRHTVAEKAEPPARPTTNINVAAILEKASAIRQAFAGSDEDDDDEDEWSDIPRKD